MFDAAPFSLMAQCWLWQAPVVVAGVCLVSSSALACVDRRGEPVGSISAAPGSNLDRTLLLCKTTQRSSVVLQAPTSVR
jgi:hypothetical protein